MRSGYIPNLTARVHLALANAGTDALSTFEVAERVGVPRGDGGFASSLVWRELDALRRRGLVERIEVPTMRYRYWRRITPDPGHPARATRRIQRRRTAGWRMPEHALYVGRPAPYGNPFPVDRHGAAGAVARFQAWIEIQSDLLALVRAELTGHDLACWCPLSMPCHADVLLRIARTAATTACPRPEESTMPRKTRDDATALTVTVMNATGTPVAEYDVKGRSSADAIVADAARRGQSTSVTPREAS